MQTLVYEAVEKSFGGQPALRGVSFSVDAGEILGLIGPNGAGKTSLIRLALDLIRPDAGSVRVFGEAPGAAALDRMSLLPEERGLYRKVPVLDMLTYLGELKGLRRAVSRERAAVWLARIGLPEVGRRRIDSLSKGMSQKVQLVTALFTEPELAILDEPFSGLDPVSARFVGELLRERRAAGHTTLLSTHQMDKAELLCDRLVMLHRGVVVMQGTAEELRAHRDDEPSTLEEVFIRAVGAEPTVREASP